MNNHTVEALRRIVEYTARLHAAHPQVTVTRKENGAA